jgi:hypothetical protein
VHERVRDRLILPDEQRHDDVLRVGADELQRSVCRPAERRSALRIVHDGVRRKRHVLHRHVLEHADRQQQLRCVRNDV